MPDLVIKNPKRSKSRVKCKYCGSTEVAWATRFAGGFYLADALCFADGTKIPIEQRPHVCKDES